jgi:hypothetical protein
MDQRSLVAMCIIAVCVGYVGLMDPVPFGNPGIWFVAGGMIALVGFVLYGESSSVSASTE